MRIQHNIMSMNAYRNYNNNASALSKNLEKLSSGYKINRAGDDAAGLAISEKMRAQIKGLEAATKNVKDGVNLVKTAEGAMQEIQDMLSRMKYLATQSANGTYDDDVDRKALQDEVDQLNKEIDRIADSANFNGTKLLDGSLGGKDAGINATPNGILSVTITGGGNKAPSADVKVSLAANGTVTIKSTAIKGLTWEAVGDASVEGSKGGTVSFKAVFDPQDTNGKSKDMDLFEGMTISVKVDQAKKDTVDADGNATYKPYTAATSAALSFIGAAKGLKLQIGDTADAYNKLTVNVESMKTGNLGTNAVNIKDIDSAASAIDTIKTAINKVSSVRGLLGATQNRLEHTQNNLSVMTENIQDAESGIRDTDVADEMMAYTKNNILIQSAQAMLAQANAVPQGVLQLLQ